MILGAGFGVLEGMGPKMDCLKDSPGAFRAHIALLVSFTLRAKCCSRFSAFIP